MACVLPLLLLRLSAILDTWLYWFILWFTRFLSHWISHDQEMVRNKSSQSKVPSFCNLWSLLWTETGNCITGWHLLEFCPPAPSLSNSAIMSTLTVDCQWEDEAVRTGGHSPSYGGAMKMKLLTLHTHGCPRASLRDCSSSALSVNINYLLIERGTYW